MKKLLFLLLFPILIFADDAELLKKLSKDYACGYQDILVNGREIHKGWLCPQRFEAIKPILDQYDRPIKILDIGANNGYFSIRAATEHNATCVMADFTLRLKRICEYNDEVPNLVYLKKLLTTEDLQYLREHEHFDVILVLNVLHHIRSPDNSKSFLAEILKLGDNVIIETPPLVDGNVLPFAVPVYNEVESYPNKTLIGSFPRLAYEGTYPTVDNDRMDSMFWFSNKPKDEFPEVYSQPIETGIKLTVFNTLRGRYPTKKQIRKEKASLPIMKRFFSDKIIVHGNKLTTN